MKLVPVTAFVNTGKRSARGTEIWQATHRKDGKDLTCTGSESEVRAWAKNPK